MLMKSPRRTRQTKSTPPVRRKASPKLLLAYAVAEAAGWPNWHRKPLNGGNRAAGALVELPAFPTPPKPKVANPRWFDITGRLTAMQSDKLRRFREQHADFTHGGNQDRERQCRCGCVRTGDDIVLLNAGWFKASNQKRRGKKRDKRNGSFILLSTGQKGTVVRTFRDRVRARFGRDTFTIRLSLFMRPCWLLDALRAVPVPRAAALEVPTDMIPARMPYDELWSIPTPKPVKPEADGAKGQVDNPLHGWLMRKTSGTPERRMKWLEAVRMYRDLDETVRGRMHTAIGEEDLMQIEDDPEPALAFAKRGYFSGDGELHYHGIREVRGRTPGMPEYHALVDILDALNTLERIRRYLTINEIRALDLAVIEKQTFEAIGKDLYGSSDKYAQRKGSAIVRAALDALADVLEIKPKIKLEQPEATVFFEEYMPLAA